MIHLGKDIYSAQYRILDHKVFVNGEIDTFLNNFEERRNDSEVESLFKVTETVGALKYELSDKCISLGSQHLKEIAAEVKGVLGEIEVLLQTLPTTREANCTAPTETQLLREKRKEEFDQQLAHNIERIESSFAVKEEEISELYSDLQLKLNISK